MLTFFQKFNEASTSRYVFPSLYENLTNAHIIKIKLNAINILAIVIREVVLSCGIIFMA